MVNINLLQNAGSQLFLPKRCRIPILLLVRDVRIGAHFQIFLPRPEIGNGSIQIEMDSAEVLATHVLAVENACSYVGWDAMNRRPV